MTRFDPNHALPLFKVISPRSKMDSVPEEKETSQKHKKKNKKPEAQVHKIQKGGSKEDIKIRKTFSANFDGKVKHKNNEDSENEDKTEHKTRIKKKYLIKENDRLTINNIELTDQLVTVQNTIQKRESTILKLKEKLVSVQNFNKDILNENNIIKMQYEDILVEVEKFKTEKSKCINCDELKILIHKNSNEYELLQKQNKDLNEDINMLKNVVYRLNVQLERYQDKLRKNNITFPKTVDSDNENITNAEITNHSDHKHSPISWGNVNAHTLGPLLDAYQDTVKEKEDIISAYEIELSNFTGKLKSVIDENEILHKNILENSGLLKKTLEEYESVKTELKNTKEQNEVLIKKCALKHDKVHELCKVYDHKIASMRRDYEILQEQYHKSRAELASTQAKYQTILDSNETLKNDRQEKIPLSVHTASVNECKRLFEELKIQYESEKNKLLKQIKQLEDQLPSLETQIVDLSTEKRELHIKTKTAERQIKKLEQKLSELQSSLTHTQISRDSCKRQLNKAIEFGKELVNEQEALLKQLSTRSKESKAAIKYGNNIASKMDSLKLQLKTVQKDAFQELATVEKRINEQDWSIESMRRDHEKEIASLVQELKEKDMFIARLVDQSAPSQPYLFYRDKHVSFS